MLRALTLVAAAGLLAAPQLGTAPPIPPPVPQLAAAPGPHLVAAPARLVAMAPAPRPTPAPGPHPVAPPTPHLVTASVQLVAADQTRGELIPDRIIHAPGRTPAMERLVASACPELAPTTTRAGAIRRVAAVSDGEPALVTALRRTCSVVRTQIAQQLRRPPDPPTGCAAVCPEIVRATVSAAREHAVPPPGPALPPAGPALPPAGPALPPAGPAEQPTRPAVPPAGPAPWTGGATGCSRPDPTGGGGCVTGATRHGMEAVVAAFGPLGKGPTFRSTGCWAQRPAIQRSDHPLGRACDLFPGTAGAFPNDEQRAAGWRVVDFLRAHAGPLRVSYLIWQGRYWDPSVVDTGGWGEPYTSSVHDITDVTGGHYDHIHVSFAE